MPKYKIRGIDVDFPYEAYDCQIVYMEKVIESLQNKCNALLESPTGTGKTLCLLCATLAWRKSLGKFSTGRSRKKGGVSPWNDLDPSVSQSAGREFPAIVYTSRTHSQLRQVIQELRRCNYRPKMAILGSREQLCIHDQVSLLRGKAQTNACQYLCKKPGNRHCEHFNSVAEYVKHNPHLGEEPVDIEDLVNIGKTSGPCPYYITRELQKDVDILFTPYNYLIDRGNRKSLKIDWNNSVLIFDEAHNLESLCADAASFDLSSGLLSSCISEAQECVELSAFRAHKSNDKSTNPESFAIIKGLLLKLQEMISEVQIQSKELGYTKPGPYIYEMLRGLNITHKTAPKLIDTIEEAVVLIEEDRQQKAKDTTSRLDSIADMLKIIFRDGGSDHAEFYSVHIQELEASAKDTIKGIKSRTLSWWCFNPGIAMQEFAKLGVGSVILTSGTLSPMDSFAQELKLPFPVRLENPHVISPNQLWAGVVPVGPSGCSFNSNYQNRDSLQYKQELGNAIVNFARIVPDGLLVFFPSYYLLDKCIECWKSSGDTATIWERICKHKKPVIEPRESSLFNLSIQDYMEKLQGTSTSGAIFFAVCRGKVSEGLDFADRAGRAVIVTGMPFARMNDPKVRLKREYLDQQMQSRTVDQKAIKTNTLTGEDWYSQQAARAVNQAIGRVIRHRHDYGAIIFCDARFQQPYRQSQISSWIRPNIKCYSRFGHVVSGLAQFFRQERSSLPTKLSLEQETKIDVSSPSLTPKPSSNGLLADAPSSSQHVSKEVKNSQPDLRRLADIPPANRAFPSANDDNKDNRLRGLSVLPRRDTKLRIRKDVQTFSSKKAKLVDLDSDETQAEIRTCSSTKAKLVDLDSEETQVESRRETIDLVSSDTGNSSSGNCFNAIGLVRKRKNPEVSDERSLQKGGEVSSPSLHRTVETATHGKKEANGSAYLIHVQEKLNAGEYQEFVGYMRDLKNKIIKRIDVMRSIVQLFSAPDRLPLLTGFKNFVPEKYQSLYEQCIRARQDGLNNPSNKLL